jgi:hypothetical protein
MRRIESGNGLVVRSALDAGDEPLQGGLGGHWGEA